MAQVSYDKETLQNFYETLALEHPEVDLYTIILLHKYGVRLTTDCLVSFMYAGNVEVVNYHLKQKVPFHTDDIDPRAFYHTTYLISCLQAIKEAGYDISGLDLSVYLQDAAENNDTYSLDELEKLGADLSLIDTDKLEYWYNSPFAGRHELVCKWLSNKGIFEWISDTDPDHYTGDVHYHRIK